MMKLYIANKNYSSWSLRPWILLTELGMDFEEILVPFETNNWDNFRKFSPTGTVPCLINNDETIWDSLAICEYLAEQNSQVWPSNNKARHWARCATAEMHAGFYALRQICTMNCGIRVKLHEITDPLQKDISRVNEIWQQGIEQFGGPFLTGTHFTAVDAFFAPVVFRTQTYDLKLELTAHSYQQHILQLDSMQQWYQAALKEHWIEPGHEQEVFKYGKIVKDLRMAISKP
ncbi:MAG: glutathione S-transferase family protein [Xanthomonadales bacterium]|nr:glutathione S-transferase family protein [Xanthomonadales bacterium]